MPFIALHAALVIAVPFMQDAVMPPLARVPLPRPAVGAPIASLNQNLVAAGRRSHDTLTLALDVVEAAYQPEGAEDPVVRILALAERGLDAVLAEVDVEPSGEAFDELSLEQGSGRPLNPMINAGALVVQVAV